MNLSLLVQLIGTDKILNILVELSFIGVVGFRL